MRAYWLGAIPVNEQERLEELCCGDEGLFERLCLAESELLDDYVSGTLPSAERAQFEAHYLVRPGRRVRLAQAQAFHRQIRVLPAPVEPAPAVSGWRTWFDVLHLGPQLALAALALACLAGGWWLWHQRSAPTELAIVTPTPGPTRVVVVSTPAVVASPLLPATPHPVAAPGPLATPLRPAPTPSSSPKLPPGPRVPVIPAPVTTAWLAPVLTGTATRSNGQKADLAVPPGFRQVRLRFALLEAAPGPAGFYVVIEDSDMKRVAQGKARAREEDGVSVATFDVSLAKLPADNYQAHLYSTRPQPGTQPLKSYSFRIISPAPAGPTPTPQN